MKPLFSIIVSILTIFTLKGQVNSITQNFDLPTTLSESSGIIYFNNTLITHNDSGNENKLYELDITSESVTRTITISNAINTDWEDITQDDTHIYIADIGNNSGDRTDLKIYKIKKSDYTSSNTIVAEIITISYSNQSDFTPRLNNNSWDAEALVSYDSTHLILFSKNWVDGNTKAYLISKTPGNYVLTPLTTTLNSGGLITGGTFNPLTAKLFLIGYTGILQPFVWEIRDFNSSDVFSGTNTQTFLSNLAFEQTEAITYVNENNYYITSESFSLGGLSDSAKLISFSTNDVALSIYNSSKTNDVVLFPNPVDDYLYIKSDPVTKVEIFDTKFARLHQGHNFKIDMSNFNSGLYFIKIHFSNHASIIKKVIKK